MVISASRELDLGRDILICTRNFVFGCNLAVEEEERVQTRMSRLGGCLASWGRTLMQASTTPMTSRENTTASSDTNVNRITSDSAGVAAIRDQTEAVVRLTEAIDKLCTIISGQGSQQSRLAPQKTQRLRWWYRKSSSESRAKEDKDGNILSGDPEWEIGSVEDIALHFAEFHSEKESKKATALISVTYDPIRALKDAFLEWDTGPFKTRDASKIFITIIESPDYYLAKHLLKIALELPLRNCLSRKARDRLNDPKNAFLHVSEAVFLKQIPREHVKFRISLQDLFDRELPDILPELCERNEHFKRRLWPKEIRAQIHRKCDSQMEKVAARFKKIYCMLAGSGTSPSMQSLKIAQSLTCDDPDMDDGLKEVVSSLLQEDIEALRMPEPTKLKLTPLRRQEVGFAD